MEETALLAHQLLVWQNYRVVEKISPGTIKSDTLALAWKWMGDLKGNTREEEW